MNNNQVEKQIERNQSIQANMIGVGSGTLLLVLAQNLPETFFLKPWLIILAPSISVAIVFLWKRFIKNLDERIKLQKVEKLRNKFREEIEFAISNPNIPKGKINDLKNKYAEFELMNIENLMESIQSIRVPNNSEKKKGISEKSEVDKEVNE